LAQKWAAAVVLAALGLVEFQMLAPWLDYQP
jgi:hypothetical protein